MDAGRVSGVYAFVPLMLGAKTRVARYGCKGAKFIEEFVCSGCERTGHATWGGEARFERKLVDMSGGFELRRDDPSPSLVIVCRHCGTAWPEQVIRGLNTDAAGPAI